MIKSTGRQWREAIERNMRAGIVGQAGLANYTIAEALQECAREFGQWVTHPCPPVSHERRAVIMSRAFYTALGDLIAAGQVSIRNGVITHTPPR